MTLRVRYVGTELSPEGVVELVPEANEFEVKGDNTLLLKARYTEGGRQLSDVVGSVHPSRWASVVAVDAELADCE